MEAMPDVRVAVPSIESRAVGPLRMRFVHELLRNSGVFPLANIVFELLLEGGRFIVSVDFFAIVFAAIAQSYILARLQDAAQPRRLLGNLVAPGFYTAIEGPLGWGAFVAAPHHWAWWLSALAIGAAQSVQLRAGPRIAYALLVIENVVRASILVVLYGSFKIETGAAEDFQAFLADKAHGFIVLAVLLLGAGSGLAAASEARNLRLLRETSALLKRYSEWLLGRNLLRQAMRDPEILRLQRRERGIVFMDIRGFTAWSEIVSPERIATAINDYYATAERALGPFAPLKLKFSADEVMALFADGHAAAKAAVALQEAVAPALRGYGLAAGIGVHYGPLVEGLYGARDVKTYDVLGDAVNVAKRIESAAAGGEVLLSEAAAGAFPDVMPRGTWRDVSVKGKSQPVRVLQLRSLLRVVANV
jgi:class 3 adenylate cyclase